MLDCMMKIEVTNMSSHSPIRAGTYSMKVPRSSLSQTLQFIHRSGGKVVEVTKIWASNPVADLPQLANSSVSTSTSPLESQSTSKNVAPVEQKPARSQSKRGHKNKR
jgi:CpcD/allophycocyanin linker domain